MIGMYVLPMERALSVVGTSIIIMKSRPFEVKLLSQIAHVYCPQTISLFVLLAFVFDICLSHSASFFCSAQ